MNARKKQEPNIPWIWSKRGFAAGLLFGARKNAMNKYLQPFFTDYIKLTLLRDAPYMLQALAYRMVKLMTSSSMGAGAGYGLGLTNEHSKKMRR